MTWSSLLPLRPSRGHRLSATPYGSGREGSNFTEGAGPHQNPFLFPPRMEGMRTEAFAMAPYVCRFPNPVLRRRSYSPVRRPANSKEIMRCLNPSHHGEAEAARPSSAEASLPSGRVRKGRSER